MAKPQLRRINAGQFQKYATVAITKELEAIAEDTGVNIKKVIADQLDETYKVNLVASYGPRSKAGRHTQETHKRKTSTYTHTHTMEEAIKTIIDGDTVKVVINEATTYEDGTPATQVYDWLTKGTNGGGYYMFENEDGKKSIAYNYPTPAHLFEEHTKLQMQGFLDSLENDIRNGKYTTYRYTGKKKKRRTYKGVDIREG